MRHRHDIAICIKHKAAAVAIFAVGADDTDGVGIHRHRTSSLRQGSTALNCCGGVQGDARERENIPCERSACTESRGAADLPEHADTCTVICTEIDKLNHRTACGRERAPYLKNPERIVVALGVESECSRQLSRARKKIDARRERESTQVLTSQVRSGRHGCQTIVRSGEINLSLRRDRISLVYRSCDGDAPQASDRGTWGETQISSDGGRAGIGYRRAAQYREVLRRTQY